MSNSKGQFKKVLTLYKNKLRKLRVKFIRFARGRMSDFGLLKYNSISTN